MSILRKMEPTPMGDDLCSECGAGAMMHFSGCPLKGPPTWASTPSREAPEPCSECGGLVHAPVCSQESPTAAAPPTVLSHEVSPQASESTPNSLWAVAIAILVLLTVLGAISSKDDDAGRGTNGNPCSKEWTGDYEADAHLLRDCLDHAGVEE